MTTNNCKSVSLYSFNKAYLGRSIFEDLDLHISKGEFTCIIGPNGCGKTTLLKAIAGLIDYKGNIQKISHKIGYVAQNTEEMLLPWLSVEANIVFPLNKKDVDPAFLESLLEITKLRGYANRYPYQLSGGMVQLLLIARALLNSADIILLDEPFKSLDFTMSKKMQLKVLELWNIYKSTILMVSHDIDEAVFMADRVIIFSDKPTIIKDIINVDLPRPRNIDMITSDKFIAIKGAVLNAFLN